MGIMIDLKQTITFQLPYPTNPEPFQRKDVSLSHLALLSVTLSPNFEGFFCQVPLGPLKIKKTFKNWTQCCSHSNLTENTLFFYEQVTILLHILDIDSWESYAEDDKLITMNSADFFNAFTRLLYLVKP